MAALQIHRTQPAVEAGQWLQQVLQPVISAVGFANPPPVELRPTGVWRGWCSDAEYAPDGRICLSSRIVFWEKELIISTYLHEAAHRLLCKFGDKVESHGPVFFTLNLVLLERVKSFFRLTHTNFQLDFYDLQDQPAELINFPDWRELCLRFARETALQLVQNTQPAEHLADLIFASWKAFLSRFSRSRRQAQIDAEKLKRFDQIVRERKLNNLIFLVAAVLFFVVYVATVYFFVS